jgi:hypothetical protein
VQAELRINIFVLSNYLSLRPVTMLYQLTSASPPEKLRSLTVHALRRFCTRIDPNYLKYTVHFTTMV